MLGLQQAPFGVPGGLAMQRGLVPTSSCVCAQGRLLPGPSSASALQLLPAEEQCTSHALVLTAFITDCMSFAVKCCSILQKFPNTVNRMINLLFCCCTHRCT